ncbi:MAG: PAS domain-containing protein, partial [Actinobacteria bacterium]|nr:PAS domain-containing protein [Actinomycetota bacterium]
MTDRVGGRAPSPHEPGGAGPCAVLSDRLDGAVVALVAIDATTDTVTPVAVHDPDPAGQAALELLLGVAVPLKGTVCAEVAATGAPVLVGEGGSASDDDLPDGWLHYSRQHGIEAAAAVAVEEALPVARIVVVARRTPGALDPAELAMVAAEARRLLGPGDRPAPAGATRPGPGSPEVAAGRASGPRAVPTGVDVVLGAIPPVVAAAVLGEATNPNSYRPTSVLVLAVAALGLLRGRVAAAACAATSMVVIWWAFTSPYRSFAIQDARGAWGLLVLAVAMAATWLLVDRVDRGRERLSDAAGLSDALIDQMPVGFALLGRDRRLRRVNQRYADLTSTPPEELLGGLPSVLHPATGPRTEALVEEVFDQEVPILDTVLEADRPRAGIEHTWRVNHFPVRSRGEVVAVGMTLEDVTDDVTLRRRAQLLLRMSRRVAGATTAAEIAVAVTETLSEGLRARCLFVAAAGESVRVAGSAGYHDPEAESAWARFTIRSSDAGPLATSLRACELVLGPTGAGGDPESVTRRAAGDVTVAWQPVVRPGDDHASAAIGVAWPFERHLTEHSRTLLQTAASVTGLA